MRFIHRVTFALPLLCLTLGALAAPKPAPADPATAESRGDQAAKAMLYPKAIEEYSAALKEKPSVAVYLKLSDSHFFGSFMRPEDEREAELIKARAALDQAKALKPVDPEILSRCAMVDGQLALYRGGKDKVRMGYGIREEAMAALKLDPDNARANAVMGVWHYELANLSVFERFFGGILYGKIPDGSLQESKTFLEKAVRKAPEVMFFHLALGRTLDDLGQHAAARVEFKKVIEMPVRVGIDLENHEIALESLR